MNGPKTLRDVLGEEICAMLTGHSELDWASVIPHVLDLPAELGMIILRVLVAVNPSTPTPTPPPQPTPTPTEEEAGPPEPARRRPPR